MKLRLLVFAVSTLFIGCALMTFSVKAMSTDEEMIVNDWLGRVKAFESWYDQNLRSLDNVNPPDLQTAQGQVGLCSNLLTQAQTLKASQPHPTSEALNYEVISASSSLDLMLQQLQMLLDRWKRAYNAMQDTGQQREAEYETIPVSTW